MKAHGLRVGAGVAAIVGALALVTPPAAAQNSSAWLNPRSPEPLESAGKVVFTVQMWRAGRVTYRTFDGACTVDFLTAGPPPATCSDNGKASAPGDYTATSGELVFTEVGGRKTITIPIVDDHVAEGDEAFTLVAWEEANADPWLRRGDSVTVHIVDDDVDPSGGGAAATASRSSTYGGPAGGQSSGLAAGATAATWPKAPGADDTAGPLASTNTTTTPTTPSPRLEVALLDADRHPKPAKRRGGGAGGSAFGLAIGSGTLALGVGVLAVVRRRKRWSAPQA